MKKTSNYLLAFYLCLVSGFVNAQSLSDVKNITQNTVNQVMQLLQNKKIDATEKNKLIITEVKNLFDFKRMAILSLGKKYW